MNIHSTNEFVSPSGASSIETELLFSPPARNLSAEGERAPRCALHHGTQVRLIAQVARLYYEEHLTPNQIAAKLRFSQGTVCRLLQNICLRFYDARGEEIESPLGARVFGLALAQLKRIARRVVIAGGKRKRQALLGALRGHWVNVLITDQFSAEALVKA